MTQLIFQRVCFLSDGTGRLEAGRQDDGDLEEGGKSRDQSGRLPHMLGENSDGETGNGLGFD